MTLNIIMLNLFSFLAGWNLCRENWFGLILNILCIIYWTISLIIKNKKKNEPTVTMSDETKEFLTKLGVKININGKEVR